MNKTTSLTLGTEKISKLLPQYAIPAIVAMTASSLYNMVDSIFIGHGVGALAIAGLAVTFPLMNLAAAFGSLVGVGASTLMAIKLGQKDHHGAEQVLGNVVLLNLIIGSLFMLVMFGFLDPVLIFFGASAETIGYARDYMEIILAGNLITHVYLGLNDSVRASGYPKKAMFATLTAVGINCVLDALFIFGFGWGIRGAAWATILAQTIALCIVVFHLCDSRHLIYFKRGLFSLKRHLVTTMLGIGLAPFLMNFCACFVVILINKSLQHYGGDLAIGAYGIINRVTFLFIMIVMGLNQGMQPIAGYNFGARLHDRLIQVLKYTILCGTGVTALGFIVCQLFPHFIVYMFTTSEELVQIAVQGLRIVLCCFPVVGFQMITSSFFQSLGMAKKAIFLSLTRQLVFLTPCLLILPSYYGTIGVWASFPVADAVATLVTVFMLKWQLKHLK